MRMLHSFSPGRHEPESVDCTIRLLCRVCRLLVTGTTPRAVRRRRGRLRAGWTAPRCRTARAPPPSRAANGCPAHVSNVRKRIRLGLGGDSGARRVRRPGGGGPRRRGAQMVQMRSVGVAGLVGLAALSPFAHAQVRQPDTSLHKALQHTGQRRCAGSWLPRAPGAAAGPRGAPAPYHAARRAANTLGPFSGRSATRATQAAAAS